MTDKNKEECCSIESVVTIDERGQMVLPKSVRETMDIKPGDKLAVVAVKSSGKPCCVTLIKAEAFSGTVKVMLKPMMESSEEDE
jgi:antitoxin PrlF